MAKNKTKRPYIVNGKEYTGSTPLEVVPPSNKAKFTMKNNISNDDIKNPKISAMINSIKEYTDKEMQKKQHEVQGLQDTQFKTTISNDDLTTIIPKETTELGQSLMLLNDSSVDPKTNLSAFNPKAIIEETDLSAIVTINGFIVMGVYPKSVKGIITEFLTLSPSVKGIGRQQIVSIAQGRLEAQSGKSIIDNIRGVPK
jgi:hypothetical protein